MAYSCRTLYINLEKHIPSCTQVISNLLTRLPVPIPMHISIFQQFILSDQLLKFFLTDEVIGIAFAFTNTRSTGSHRGHDVNVHALLFECVYHAIFSRPRWCRKDEQDSLFRFG